MTLLLAGSALVAILVAEIGCRAVGSVWLRRGLRDVDSQLRLFRAATTDDERQRRILQAGFTTLRFSLSVLGLIGLLLLMVGVVPWAAGSDGSQLTVFYGAVSIGALAWSFVRARHLAADSPSARVPHELQ